MYSIIVEESFDSAHFLSGYNGKCSHIHGHRWRLLVEVQTKELQDEGQCKGMVVDFTQLKKDLKKLAEDFDHCLIIEKETMREQTLNCLVEDGFRIVSIPFRPTAEKFAEFFFHSIEKKGYQVKRVSVYETPNNCAVYEG
ncbi:6-pyruvoyl trahydropterin synthase family protein [Anaerosacchariphilus polymeriproducens]|uniref:6-carboxy-5,6,7,8-tetrahydropterin synthase n=1 Tax=Anaerosacchariphilus polymeriproducens TaxID=1812858 RepID=A0A371AXT7_9FIRM|nr:6-carboxytetrahydropterin synthase [Anaerosacchariphilus polymeriproducens]RDU24290.1 6-carboxytetrahydropterin synthase [Anaerosacchariphilus polymeriproducens]